MSLLVVLSLCFGAPRRPNGATHSPRGNGANRQFLKRKDKWSGREDSNLRPCLPKTVALPRMFKVQKVQNGILTLNAVNLRSAPPHGALPLVRTQCGGCIGSADEAFQSKVRYQARRATWSANVCNLTLVRLPDPLVQSGSMASISLTAKPLNQVAHLLWCAGPHILWIRLMLWCG